MNFAMAVLAVGPIAIGVPAVAETPIRTGLVLRGVQVPGTGPAGTGTGMTCNFAAEPVDRTGRLTRAGVELETGTSPAELGRHLPPRFNAYCVVNAAQLPGARLITAPTPTDAAHGELSGMSPRQAQMMFGGAIWR